MFRAIANGVSGTDMTGVDLGDAQIWQLVAQVRSLAAAAIAAGTSARQATRVEPVSASDLESIDSTGSEWLTYSGSYNGRRHSRLAQIDRSNVAGLRLAWMRQIDNDILRVETTPLVRGKIMFLTEPPNHVIALEAATGVPIWAYKRALPEALSVCCKRTNRGLAILGDKVYLGTLDAHLVALDAASGRVVWDVEVMKPNGCGSINAAPLAVRGLIVTGIVGGDCGVRGFVDAYDAETGARRWRFYTVPSPEEPGGDTWSGESWRTGGAPTWLTGSFDPELNLIYWGVGSAAPNFIGDHRLGDNLYSNSVIALDADSGRLRWHFQFTPHGEHGWDSVQIPVLADLPYAGSSGRLMLWANRNAFYYVLDRVSGKFLLGTPFVRQTWADGLDASGRPLLKPLTRPSETGTRLYPAPLGGTNWWSPAYNPATRLFYVPTLDREGLFTRTTAEFKQGELFEGGVGQPVKGKPFSTSVRALKADSGELVWEYKRPSRTSQGQIAGLVTTSGNLVFGSDLNTLFALDALSGEELWSINVGSIIFAAPMTFELDGRQFVTVAAGHNVLTFTLPTDASVATTQ
jgi:alcohol dehydrogenase (cytochrome c)